MHYIFYFIFTFTQEKLHSTKFYELETEFLESSCLGEGDKIGNV